MDIFDHFNMATENQMDKRSFIKSAGLIGLAGGFLLPDKFLLLKGESEEEENAYVRICEDPIVCHTNPSKKRSFHLTLIFFFLWALPFIVLFLTRAPSIFVTEGFFFTKAAFLTFGGAYSVLAYIAQAGVEQFHWLTAPQMLDGLGLAETTPGPLIMVVQFIGFMAGWNQSGPFQLFWGGVIGSLVATYFTFLPSFFLILLGGPYVEMFRENKNISAALSSITASVVGIVMNLAVWFALQILLPETGGFNLFGAIIGAVAFCALQWGKAGMIPVIGVSAGLGLIWNFLAVRF